MYGLKPAPLRLHLGWGTQFWPIRADAPTHQLGGSRKREPRHKQVCV